MFDKKQIQAVFSFFFFFFFAENAKCEQFLNVFHSLQNYLQLNKT